MLVVVILILHVYRMISERVLCLFHNNYLKCSLSGLMLLLLQNT